MLDSHFFENLSTPKKSNRWVIGFSGGLDSTALLHLCVHFRRFHQELELVAVHVNHQISPLADEWQSHCQALCEQLKVSFYAEKVDLNNDGRRSLEQVARDTRYQVFQQVCQPNDLLLLAHHLDDQVETLLYRLARGSGVLGLRGMDAYVERNELSIWRPLISTARSDLETYCADQQLQWVEDPSNQDTSYDRNFIRQELVPLMESRWPALRQTLGRSSRLLGEAAELTNDLAMIDLESCQQRDALGIADLKQLTVPRQKNCLRHWISASGATLPSEKILAQVMSCIEHYHDELNADISWSGDFSGKSKLRWQIHTFRGNLYLEKGGQPFDPDWQRTIEVGDSLALPPGLGTLNLSQASSETAQGQSVSVQQPLTVRFRQGGEQFRPAGRKQKLLKKWLQDWDIPPWKRDRIPLIYQGEQLVAVAGQAVAEGFQPQPGEPALLLCWNRSLD